MHEEHHESLNRAWISSFSWCQGSSQRCIQYFCVPEFLPLPIALVSYKNIFFKVWIWLFFFILIIKIDSNFIFWVNFWYWIMAIKVRLAHQIKDVRNSLFSLVDLLWLLYLSTYTRIMIMECCYIFFLVKASILNYVHVS